MTFIFNFFWICYWIVDDNYFYFLWSIVFDANNDSTISILCMKDEGIGILLVEN